MEFMLGAANFGNKYKEIALNENECFAIMDKAWELGIRTIDTAASYGESERIISDWCLIRRKRFKVYTKGRSEDDFDRSEQILGYALHAKLWHNYDPGEDEVLREVDGVSCYGMEWLDLLHEVDISIIQVPWNVLDRRHDKTADMAHDYGVQAICRSIFIRGEAFKMPEIGGRPFWHWCLQNVPDFDYVIVGADTPQQLEEIVNVPRFEMRYTDEGVKSAKA